MVSEEKILARILRMTAGGRLRHGTLGIGDDAAILPLPLTRGRRGALLVTTDLFVEAVHFDLATALEQAMPWAARVPELHVSKM